MADGEWVWMTHPLLPPDQLIYEPEEALFGLRQAGWVETDPPPPEEP